jgi:hypothetical protein
LPLLEGFIIFIVILRDIYNVIFCGEASSNLPVSREVGAFTGHMTSLAQCRQCPFFKHASCSAGVNFPIAPIIIGVPGGTTWGWNGDLTEVSKHGCQKRDGDAVPEKV